MKAVVMAGGEGSRLRPLTVGRPKPMVPIVNKSVMAHILDLLKNHGITDVVVTLRYMASTIQDFFEDGRNLGMRLTYVVEESPLGTAGSVKNAERYLDDTFLVISGDALTDFDLGRIIQTHREREALASLTLTHVANPLEFGVIVTGEDGRILGFQEKPSWGEIMSDTVNTGIYVLEPEVLEMIPSDVAYDFSTDLFPLLLQKKLPLYGYVADGYWCDVGTIEEYRRANADLLFGKVKLSSPIGQHVGGGIWVGQDVEIAPSAQLFGPIYLGNGVKIKGDVTIYGPSVIRDYTIVDAYTRIERSILWRNNYVGENCELRGTVVARQCSIKSNVVAYEGVVIGDNNVLGEGCVLHAEVKLWPHKEIEAGATVKDSIIWGNQGRRSLFGRFGVTGVVNVDLTPEFAAKLGAALGATLPKNSYVALNRDIHRSSRMLKRALISGLPGTGVNVWDLGTVAIPVLRHFVRKHANTSAGIHVRLSPFDQRVVDIRFIDHNGLNQSKAAERAIERSFFREDFRRAYLDEIGLIQYANRPIEEYTEDFLAHVDVDRIRQAHFRIVIDYSHGLAADTLSHILNKLGVDTVPLNARMDETKLAMLQHEFHANLERVAKIVGVLDADMGIQLDVGGEKIFLVDEHGRILDDLTAAALMVELALYAHPGRTVAVPATMPNAIDTIAAWHEGRVLRINNNLHSLMTTAQQSDILLVTDGTGNFIFPPFQPAVDGMMAVACLLEYLAVRQAPLSEVVSYLPPMNLVRHLVNCPWDAKARVMRELHRQHTVNISDNIDGLKICLENQEWVHIAPDPDRPYLEVVAEGQDPERAQQLVNQFSAQIQALIETVNQP
ncbi:NTP transferase domain-containing protein [Litorilinea aerophila]|uniref:Nucleotidyl transferase n=1 Tax=Litorilinea aerophila TaxID=1204385 RepID=A0A540VJS5_9CHLR|nr:sugar phosphate nucleotidyltransferase [Litorilinea aerophila]MCC9075467.1 NTP transferase domain-containing protein [Litorilinea aerophila]GIV76350.1 MAG: nucleotidyltransferase [Litorilinea sp.]